MAKGFGTPTKGHLGMFYLECRGEDRSAELTAEASLLATG